MLVRVVVVFVMVDGRLFLRGRAVVCVVVDGLWHGLVADRVSYCLLRWSGGRLWGCLCEVLGVRSGRGHVVPALLAVDRRISASQQVTLRTSPPRTCPIEQCGHSTMVVVTCGAGVVLGRRQSDAAMQRRGVVQVGPPGLHPVGRLMRLRSCCVGLGGIAMW